MRMEQAEYARGAKREEAMCASALCTASHNLKEAPDGFRGRYGGHHLCPKHYRQVVDSLLESLDEHGCAPWEDEHPSNQGDSSSKLEDLFK